MNLVSINTSSEFNESEENVIPFQKPKRAKFQVVNAMKYLDILHKPKNLLAACDLFFNSATDYEVFNAVYRQAKILGESLLYPDDFERKRYIDIFYSIPEEQRMAYGQGLLNQWLSSAVEVATVMLGDELFGILIAHKPEPKFSIYMSMDVRGTHRQKTLAAIALREFWKDFCKHWYKKGFRYITTDGFLPRTESFLKNVTKNEKFGKTFFKSSRGRPERYDGKTHFYRTYTWDLFEKFRGEK